EQVIQYQKLLDEFDHEQPLSVTRVKNYRQALELRLELQAMLYSSFIIDMIYVISNYLEPKIPTTESLISTLEKSEGIPIEEIVQYSPDGSKKVPEISGMGYFNTLGLK